MEKGVVKSPGQLKMEFLEIFARYRGEEAKQKLLEKEMFFQSERAMTAARAEKGDEGSDFWKRQLDHDNDLLNWGNTADLRHDWNSPMLWSPPIEAIEFVRHFLEVNQFKAHYDVLQSSASCSLYLDTPLVYGNALMVAQAAYEVARPDTELIDWHFEDSTLKMHYLSFEEVHQDNADDFNDGEGFDLITPWMPWPCYEDEDPREVPANFSSAVVKNVGKALAPGGTIVSWMPTNELRWTKGLRQNGLCVKAVYVLPTKESYGQIKESALVVFKKQAWSTHCYVNRMPSGDKLRESFGHWTEKECAKSGGEWLDLKEFRTDYSTILEWRKIEKKLRRSGVEFKPFEAMYQKEPIEKSNADGWHIDGWHISAYEGEDGEEWCVKDSLWGAYFLFWLQSKDGQLWMKFWGGGFGRESLYPVPALTRQREDLSAWSKLSQAKARISDLLDMTFQGNKEVAMAAQAFQAVASTKDFDRRLPWPLSSILRAYNVETALRMKMDRLNYFFEAATVFFPSVLLSLVWSNEDLKNRFGDLQTSKKKADGSSRFLRSDMGAWQTLFGTLQKFLRKEDERLGGGLAGLSAKLGGVDQGFLSKLLDKELTKVVDEARTGRNDRAHWGALGETECKEIHKRLHDCLGNLDKALGFAFEASPLIAPVKDTMSFTEDGIFKVKARKLVGASESFDRVEVETLKPLIEESVYLHTPDEKGVVKLLPTILIDSKNVCRFYNRKEKDGIRYVSYQADLEANSRVEPMSELMAEVLAYLA